MTDDDTHPLILHAPAKLNLSLHVGSKREDGFHSLVTLMSRVNIYDTLEFVLREDQQLTLEILATDGQDVSDIPCDQNNLIIQAAELLRQKSQSNWGAHIRLIKRIPSQAGMGGGSSDAATTFMGLNRLWNLGFRQQQLQEFSAQIGSDVPYFLGQSNWAVCHGRGENVVDLDQQANLPVVIFHPGFGCSTKEIFGEFQPLTPLPDLPTYLQQIQTQSVETLLQNDLQQPAVTVEPQLQPLLKSLNECCPRGAMMTGSGSAMFGLCNSYRQSTRVSSQLQQKYSKQYPQAKVFAAQMIG